MMTIVGFGMSHIGWKWTARAVIDALLIRHLGMCFLPYDHDCSTPFLPTRALGISSPRLVRRTLCVRSPPAGLDCCCLSLKQTLDLLERHNCPGDCNTLLGCPYQTTKTRLTLTVSDFSHQPLRGGWKESILVDVYIAAWQVLCNGWNQCRDVKFWALMLLTSTATKRKSTQYI
jgi:hypothetical protein